MNILPGNQRLPNGAQENNKPTLIATNVSKAFLSGVVSIQVLNQLSVSILPGELTLIAGPSGCGKSTLLSILSGLQPSDGGKVVAL